MTKPHSQRESEIAIQVFGWAGDKESQVIGYVSVADYEKLLSLIAMRVDQSERGRDL